MFGNVIQCNPIANSDPNGDYSKGVAYILSLLHGAHGIVQNKKTGEWGYKYSLSRFPGAKGVDYGPPPQKKQDGNRSAVRNSKPSVPGVNAAQGGGGRLNTTNDWLGYSGYAEGAIGAVQIGMLSYRKSLPINSKIGTLGSFSIKYRALGTTGKVLGRVGYAGAVVNTIVDYNSMQSGEIGAGRFGYRTAGTLGSIGGGIGIGAVYVGPWGAVGAAVIGGASWAGEKMYDGYILWQTQMSIYLTNFENGLKNGWVPGR